MGIVYQLTFFLALGLLAIVVAIFVFAVSQVGRATAASSKEQQDILSQQKKAKAKRIESIEKQIAKAKKTGNLDLSKLLSELDGLTKESAEYEAELRHIRERIILISRKGAVVCPGAFFLATLILTITASGLAEGQNLVALPLWIISIGTLAFGIFRVFKTLGAIEKVTITSQEAIEKLPDAVKVALRGLEEEKKPKLELNFVGEQPPFHIEAGAQTTVPFSLSLTHGEVARKLVVAFFAPPNFDFAGGKTYLQPETKIKIGGCKTTYFDLEDCLRGVDLSTKVTIKAPSDKGNFTLFYRINCEGFASGFEEFEVVIE